MNRAWRKSIVFFIYQLRTPVFFLLFLLFTGSVGYSFIEKWNWLDSLYMTVITLSTVGFGEIHNMHSDSRVFTILLILGGIIFYGLAINFIFKVFMENNLRDLVRKKHMEEKIRKLNKHYIIAGGGRMAMGIAEEFEKSGLSFVVIEPSPDAVIFRLEKDWPILQKDAKEEDVLIEAGIERAHGIASVLPDDSSNLFIVLTARMLNPQIEIHTRIAEESSRKKMVQAGANKIVSPFTEGGLQMARSFINPQVYELLEIFVGKANYEFEVDNLHVDQESPYLNQILRDSDFREKGLLVIGIRKVRGNFTFAPSADYRFEEGDDILVMGPSRYKEGNK